MGVITMILIAIAIILAILGIYWHYKSVALVDSMFPGPTTIPIVGNAIELLRHMSDTHGYFQSYFYYYRRSYRIWIGNRLHIFLIDGEEVEKVFGNTTHLEKSGHYDYLLDWIGRGLLTSTGNKWRKHRKMLTPSFHFNILENFVDIFNQNVKILGDILDKKVGSSGFDVYDYVKRYALDNIVESSMGTKVDAQLDPESPYVKAVRTALVASFKRAMSPWLWPSLFYELSGYASQKREALRIIHGLTNQVIRQRKEEFKSIKNQNTINDTGIKKRRPFLDTLLMLQDEQGLSDEDIREEVDTFMFEGHDTISSAISFALFSLADYPEFQDKAYKEQIEIFGSDNREPTLQDIQAMKYLELVVKETLRHYPSVPAIGRTLQEDVIIDDKTFMPKGAEAILIAQALHHNFHRWENATVFDPEVMNPDNKSQEKRHPFQYAPFSAGPRNCIGQRFAMLELKATLSSLIRRFRFLPAKPYIPLKLEVDLILVSSTGINIRVERRSNNYDFIHT